MKASYAQLTDMTGKAYRTIKTRIDGLQPVGTGQNNANLWESTEALPLIYEVGKDKGKLDGPEEKARLDRERRIGQELKNKQMVEELIPAGDVGLMLSRLVAAAKTKLLGIKSKIGPLLNESIPDAELKDKIISLIDQQVRESLTELSQSGDD